MSIIVFDCQHCDEQEFQDTVICTLHAFLSSKVRFIHTSTVTGSDSCPGKNYAYASRTSCSKLLLVVANLCHLPFFANKLVCTVLTDLLTRFCGKLICMYVYHVACLK